MGLTSTQMNQSVTPEVSFQQRIIGSVVHRTYLELRQLWLSWNAASDAKRLAVDDRTGVIRYSLATGSAVAEALAFS